MSKKIRVTGSVTVPANFQFDLELSEETFKAFEALQDGYDEERTQLARQLLDMIQLPELPYDHDTNFFGQWSKLCAEFVFLELDKAAEKAATA